MASDREVLTLICASCGRIFASAVQMEPGTFEQIRLNRQMERCPSLRPIFALFEGRLRLPLWRSLAVGTASCPWRTLTG